MPIASYRWNRPWSAERANRGQRDGPHPRRPYHSDRASGMVRSGRADPPSDVGFEEGEGDVRHRLEHDLHRHVDGHGFGRTVNDVGRQSQAFLLRKFYDGDNIGIRRGLWAPLMPVDGEGLDGRSPGERFVVDIPRQAAPADRRRRMVPPSTVTASRHSKLSREAAGPEVLVALVECRRNAWYCSLSVQNSSPSRSTEPMTQGPYSLERSVATGVVRGRQSKREIGTWQMTRPASRGSASPM